MSQEVERTEILEKAVSRFGKRILLSWNKMKLCVEKKSLRVWEPGERTEENCERLGIWKSLRLEAKGQGKRDWKREREPESLEA